MTTVEAHAFAREWIEAWNAHDLERVLSHYADEVELVSPTAARVVPESGGVIRGKPALRAYWTKALAQVPTLHFDLEDVFASVDGATVLYRNHRGQRVTEMFRWNAEGRVVQTVIGHAPAGGAAAAAAAAAATETEDLYCMIARVSAAGVDAFLRYEAGVLPLLADFGATLEYRLRSRPLSAPAAAAPADLVEIHIVRFPDASALAAYRADARRAALAPELAGSGAAIELVAVQRV